MSKGPTVPLIGCRDPNVRFPVLLRTGTAAADVRDLYSAAEREVKKYIKPPSIVVLTTVIKGPLIKLAKRLKP